MRALVAEVVVRRVRGWWCGESDGAVSGQKWMAVAMSARRRHV